MFWVLQLIAMKCGIKVAYGEICL